jgi:hypothetical protein
VSGKPAVADLGVDPDRQHWQRSGSGSGAIEIAVVRAAPTAASVLRDQEDWVLMRVTGDPEGRVLVFDRHEWECFLDGARRGEFDDAASPAAP